MKNMVKIALVLTAIVALATVAQAETIDLDKYTTQKLLYEVLSPTAYIDLLKAWGNSFVSGDKLFQRVSAPTQTYKVGKRHELYLSDKQGYTFDCRPGERITKGIRDLSGNKREESWYLAIPLKANAKDMRNVKSETNLKNIGIRLNIDEYLWVRPDPIVMILTHPVVVRDNWIAYSLSYGGCYYCDRSYTYDYGKVIPAGTVVAFAATGQPAMRKSVSYKQLSRYGTFPYYQEVDAWNVFVADANIVVKPDILAAVKPDYSNDDGWYPVETIMKGDHVYVAKKAIVENRNGKIKTAEQLRHLGLKSSLISTSPDGTQTVNIDLWTPRFRLSKGMTYSAADSAFRYPQYAEHLDKVIQSGNWLKTTDGSPLGHISIIVNASKKTSEAAIAAAGLDTDEGDWRDGLTDAEIAEIEAEQIVSTMDDTVDTTDEDIDDEEETDTDMSDADDDEETGALGDNAGGCNAANHGLMLLVTLLGFVVVKRS